MPLSTPLPLIWRRLPIDPRRRLAVLIGRRARRRLDPARAAPAERPGEERADGTPNSPAEIGGRHRDRLAIVYVRQSPLQQVGRHPESTRLQYALAGPAPGSSAGLASG